MWIALLKGNKVKELTNISFNNKLTINSGEFSQCFYSDLNYYNFPEERAPPDTWSKIFENEIKLIFFLQSSIHIKSIYFII